LAQTFTSADGRRVNDYSLSPDGRTLTMQVTETSPRLSQTIAYKQVYRRVSWKRMPTDLLSEWGQHPWRSFGKMQRPQHGFHYDEPGWIARRHSIPT